MRKKLGRPPLDESVKKMRVEFFSTPWMKKVIVWVVFNEAAKHNRISMSRAIRGLLQLGVERYRELGSLPDTEK